MKKVLSYVIIGIICSVVTAYATIMYKASDVSYINSNKESTNVQDAIDELYNFTKDKNILATGNLKKFTETTITLEEDISDFYLYFIIRTAGETPTLFHMIDDRIEVLEGSNLIDIGSVKYQKNGRTITIQQDITVNTCDYIIMRKI